MDGVALHAEACAQQGLRSQAILHVVRCASLNSDSLAGLELVTDGDGVCAAEALRTGCSDCTDDDRNRIEAVIELKQWITFAQCPELRRVPLLPFESLD